MIAALGGVVDCAVPAVPRYTSEGTALQGREREEDGGEVVEGMEATVLQRELSCACKALREEGREVVVYGEEGRVDVFDLGEGGEDAGPERGQLGSIAWVLWVMRSYVADIQVSRELSKIRRGLKNLCERLTPLQ